MEWFNRRDGILTNVCGYTIWCFHENMTFSNNWVNCCLITLQLQVLHSFDKPFYVNEFPTKMNHVAFFSSTKTNTKMELFSQLVKQHDFGYCAFLELTNYLGQKKTFLPPRPWVGRPLHGPPSNSNTSEEGRCDHFLSLGGRCRGFPPDC